jgi:hypothetical protein
MRTNNAKVKLTYTVGNREISVDSILVQLELTLNAIIHELLRSSENDDYIRVALRNQYLDYEIFVPFRKVEDFTTEALLNEIIKVSQSKKEFLMSGLIEVDVIHVRATQIGGSRSKYSIIDVNKWRRDSKKLVQITKDGYCVARSIIVSKAYEDGIRGLEWRRIRSDTNKIQYKKAVELCKLAKVTVGNHGVKYEDFDRFQAVLTPNYQLIVVTPPKNYHYIGTEAEKKLYLFLSENHCDALLSIKAFLKCDYFCKKCLKGYSSRANHVCESICKFCFGENQCEVVDAEQMIVCNDCKRDFANQTCFVNHKSKTKICMKIWKCNKCNKTLNTKTHHCGKFKCRICKVLVPYTGHLCYITPNDKQKILEEDSNPKIFIFYDFESQQNLQESNEYIHKPNFCVVFITCDKCWEENIKDRRIDWCYFCGNKEYIFKGLQTVDEFCIFLFDSYASFIKNKKIYMKLKEDIMIYVIAHNSRGYDSQFILKYCVKNRITPSVIRKGTKILSMKIKNIKFIDSLSFLPMALKNLPECFGFNSQIEKGKFPFYFNKPGNENYRGSWPAIEYYDPDQMDEKEREKFLEWYEKQRNKEFVFETEIEKYCRNDVDILMRCSMTFRQIFKSVSGIDPFCRSITIAQSVMEVFKTNFLKINQLAICPPEGYEPKRRVSYLGHAWLDFLEKTENIVIIREVRVGQYYVDGINEREKKVYEFYGDIWHGCKECFPNNRSTILNPYNGVSMQTLHKNLEKRESYIKNLGYDMITLWECKLKSMRKNDKSINKFFIEHINQLKDKKHRPPLHPKDSFFGGRCAASKLYHVCDSDEKIFYMDFTSLYPFVVKRKRYPIGHPIRITENFDPNISVYEGFIFCKILPPRNLYFAVLPVRMRNKLIFPLCLKCAYDQNNQDCFHIDAERCLVGTWTTMELKKALEKSYKLIEVYEIWHFRELSPQHIGEPGIFTEFINTYIKLKVESSGWPKNDMSENEKDEYVQLYKEREDIILKKEDIDYNPGMRAIGKLVVVSFWGKFAQSCNLNKTQYITEPQEFFKLLSDDTIIVTDALLISDETLQVCFEKDENFLETPSHSSIIIASWVTSYARLELYNLLDKLRERVLYFDTDSVIFTAREGEYIPPTGLFIGDLTNEITTKDEPEAYIAKFASCGSKNYSYEVYYPNSGIRKYFCKVKGLSLNFITSNIVNFDSMKMLIEDAIELQNKNSERTENQSEPKVLSVPQKTITVTPFLELLTKEIKKKYRFVYDKRRIIPSDLTTIPFGYQRVEQHAPPMP